MKHLKIFSILFLTLVLFWNCGSVKNEETLRLEEQQFQELKNLVNNRNFEFTAEVAYPMQTYAVTQVTNVLLRNTGNTSGAIFLNGNEGYIQIKEDTISADLPYYGEVRVVTSTDPRDAGINFNSNYERYKLKENTQKKQLNLEFDVKARTDRYNVIMQLYLNKKAHVIVNSMNRTSIRFDGKLSEIEE